MSEFNPFAASEEVAEYVPEEVIREESEAGSKRNVVALGALAALAVGAGAFFFLGGSGDEEPEPFVLPAPKARAAAPAASGPLSTLPVASKVDLGRNPFRALYVAPAVAAAPVGGTTTTPTTATGGTTTGTTTTPIVIVDSGTSGGGTSGGTTSGGTTSGGTTSGGTTAPPPAASAPAQSTVALKSVTAGKDGSNPTATFDYDGKKVSGAPGDVMAGKLLVISIQQDVMGGWFVNLQLGDGEPFEVHERQTVVVQ